MGAIAINPKQTTIGGGVQRETKVTLPSGIVPTGTYWLGLKIRNANKLITRLSMTDTVKYLDILALPRNAAVEADLRRAYGSSTTEEWWGFEVQAGALPSLYPSFTVYFSLQKKVLGPQRIPWQVIQKPSLGSGGFGSGVPEAQGHSDIAGVAISKEYGKKKKKKKKK